MSWRIERKYQDKYTESKDVVTSEFEYLVYSGDGSVRTLDEARIAFTEIFNWQTLRDERGNRPSEFTIEEEENSAGTVFIARVRCQSLPDEQQTLGIDNPWWCESFDTSGGSSHITYGKDERFIAFNPYDRTIPRFGGGIGWNGETFEGCDITTPALTFTAKTRMRYRDIDQSIIEQFAMSTGAINDRDFCGFARHCVQCSSVKGDVIFLPTVDAITENEYGTPVQAVEAWYEFVCEFCVQPWVNVYVDDQRFIRKNGYDYLWVLYETVDDQESNMTISKPKAIYVNQVYPEIDFSWFGIRFYNY